MNPNQIPEKPLYASPDGKLEQAQPIYFFEREDGTIIHAQGREAWNLYSRKPQVIGYETRRPKFIGVSDGTVFQKAVIDMKAIYREKGLQAAQEYLRNAQREELEKARLNKTPPQNADRFEVGRR